MSMLSSAAIAARESVRDHLGRFGVQSHSAPELSVAERRRVALDQARTAAYARWRDEFEIAASSFAGAMVADDAITIRDGDGLDGETPEELAAQAAHLEATFDGGEGLDEDARRELEGRLALFMLHDPVATDQALEYDGGPHKLGARLYRHDADGARFAPGGYGEELAERLRAAAEAPSEDVNIADRILVARAGCVELA